MWIKCNFVTGVVYANLSFREILETIGAHFVSLLFGGCAADYMSEELEAVLCGWAPERYFLEKQ